MLAWLAWQRAPGAACLSGSVRAAQRAREAACLRGSVLAWQRARVAECSRGSVLSRHVHSAHRAHVDALRGEHGCELVCDHRSVGAALLEVGGEATREGEQAREVRGARCSVPIVIKSQVVLEVGAKISFENTTTTSTKTTRKLDSLAKFTRPRVKDYATDGADFNGERLVVAACVPRYW